MSSRMRKPETAKLDITRGDWLLVKKHLTAGEQRSIFTGMLREDGEAIDRSKIGLSKVAGYLLDWSVTDSDDKPVVIFGQSTDVIEAALNALDIDSFTEIMEAVEAHIAAMEKVRAQEKKGPDGANGSSAISPSVASTTGDMVTSPSSPLMSTTS
jgi:hypothetical protein